ncbi:MAG TPA: hypothetical protein VMT10_14655 [Solirubrobacteraceae bacterium]|nr:hypothetical protein [Solirubrobacteraceae bacterium]
MERNWRHHGVRLWTALALACALLLIAAAPAPAKTQIVHWSPFLADGGVRRAIAVTPRYHGDCWEGSFVAHRGYRCIAGNLIYDPCFADPLRDRTVVCAADPWARGVVRLRVSGRFANDFSAPAGTVWALRLADGARCSLQAGGTHEVDSAGRGSNYYCRHSDIVLWGNPTRTGTWTIRLSHSPFPGPEKVARIRTAYIASA